MKNRLRIINAVIFILCALTFFFLGKSIQKQQYRNERLQHCRTLLSFAVDKVKNEDISDPDTMKALISNVYAAYTYCDDVGLAEQLHDLWNILIFEIEAPDWEETVRNRLTVLTEAIELTE